MGYLRQHQVDELENEKQVLERTLQHRDVQDRGNIQQHVKRIDRQVEDQSPPDLTGEERDEKVRECQNIEAQLQPLMPSDEEMRRNPPGTVGRHMRYEKVAKGKTEQYPEGPWARWKDNQLALNKGSDDPDVANFERMRPRHNMASMQGAQIPGTQYHGTNPSEAYKEGFDRTFDVDKEVTSIDDPEDVEPEKVEAKPVTRKKTTRKKKGAKKGVKMTMLACGREMGPQGQHSHIAHCETCQEAAEE